MVSKERSFVICAGARALDGPKFPRRKIRFVCRTSGSIDHNSLHGPPLLLLFPLPFFSGGVSR